MTLTREAANGLRGREENIEFMLTAKTEAEWDIVWDALRGEFDGEIELMGCPDESDDGYSDSIMVNYDSVGDFKKSYNRIKRETTAKRAEARN